MKKLVAACLLAILCCSCVTPDRQRERSGDVYLKRNPSNLNRIEGYDRQTHERVFEIRRNPFNLNRWEIRQK